MGKQCGLKMQRELSKLAKHFEKKSLMVFDDQVYCYDGHSYSSNEAFILFILALRNYFRNVTLCSRLHERSQPESYTIPQTNIEICAFPYYKSMIDFFAKSIILLPKIWHIIKINFHKWDLLWLTWPHPLSLLMLIKAKRAEKLCILVIRQNLRELVKQRYNGWQKIMAVFLVDFLEWQLRRRCENVVILTVGHEMYRKFSQHFCNVHAIEISLISQSNLTELSPSPRLSNPNPVRLLFVGRLEPEKGLPSLLDALVLLKQQNRNVHLDIVGSGVEEEFLKELAAKLKIARNLTFHGYVPFGEDLFSYYRGASVLVLPSLSEGIPQVLWEAMAFNVPIVATRIPSIQGVIRHGQNGILTEPDSSAALSEAIGSLLDHPTVAAKLCRQARADSHSHTMEVQHETILKTLASYVK